MGEPGLKSVYVKLNLKPPPPAKQWCQSPLFRIHQALKCILYFSTVVLKLLWVFGDLQVKLTSRTPRKVSTSFTQASGTLLRKYAHKHAACARMSEDTWCPGWWFLIYKEIINILCMSCGFRAGLQILLSILHVAGAPSSQGKK